MADKSFSMFIKNEKTKKKKTKILNKESLMQNI